MTALIYISPRGLRESCTVARGIERVDHDGGVLVSTSGTPIARAGVTHDEAMRLAEVALAIRATAGEG